MFGQETLCKRLSQLAAIVWSSFQIKNTIHCADSIMSACHSIMSVCNSIMSSCHSITISHQDSIMSSCHPITISHQDSIMSSCHSITISHQDSIMSSCHSIMSGSHSISMINYVFLSFDFDCLLFNYVFLSRVEGRGTEHVTVNSIFDMKTPSYSKPSTFFYWQADFRMLTEIW